MKTKYIISALICLMVISFTYALIEGTLNKNIILDKEKIVILESLGIKEPIINPCIKIDEFICKSKVYEKDGINKEIKVIYKYCNNWTQPPENQTENQTEEFISECLKWITLSQEEIETEVINKTDNLLNQIAEIQISRSQRVEEPMTREIKINIK